MKTEQQLSVPPELHHKHFASHEKLESTAIPLQQPNSLKNSQIQKFKTIAAKL
jgi:hypothetical protein